MKPANRPSLRVQTIVILIVGLVLSHLAGLYIYTLDRRDAVAMTETFDIAERASGVIFLLRNLPEGLREDALTASDSRSFRVWRTDEPILRSIAETEDDRSLLEYLRTLVPHLAGREMRVAIHKTSPAGAEPPPKTEPPGARTGSVFDAAAKIVTISIHHPEGFWLNFVGAVPRPASLWPGVFSAYIFTVAFGVSVIGFWLVGRVTKPLEEFTHAADRLGKDIRTIPLNQEGPKEVALATVAFNRMQERIARLVENRVELLAAISHDLRTPITKLKLRAELLEADKERERFLSMLEEMEAIMSTFLEYARSSFGKEERSRTEMTSLAESICSDFEDMGCDAVFKQGPKAFLECKRSAIRRAVSNMIDNAVKYGGGAEVRVCSDRHEIRIIVEDNGPGIPDSDLESVLMPFHRGEPSRNKETGGSGLGLSIAQAVAHDHGGELSLENRDAGGLRVTLTLPL